MATLTTARRYLRSAFGENKLAVKMFVQALELRKRDRKLFQTMRFESQSDVRIMGRDLEGHPLIYICWRSQTQPIALLRDQLIVTLEAAFQLSGEKGKIAYIFDMHGLQPGLNTNPTILKELVDIFGTVFADTICRVTMVDFSRAAQALWWMLKPLMAETTKQKFSFVTKAQARETCRAQLSDELYQAVCKTFEINRDKNSTPEERAEHARRTTMYNILPGLPVN